MCWLIFIIFDGSTSYFYLVNFLTTGEEKKINPFMRVTTAPVQKHAGTTEAVATMAAIRTEKDNWKPPKL